MLDKTVLESNKLTIESLEGNILDTKMQHDNIVRLGDTGTHTVHTHTHKVHTHSTHTQYTHTHITHSTHTHTHTHTVHTHSTHTHTHTVHTQYTHTVGGIIDFEIWS